MTDDTSSEAGAEVSEAEPDRDTPADLASALPTDPAEWRRILSAVPPKDLLRVVQQDRYLSARVLTGFRAAPDTLRRPQVVDRLSKEIAKLPKIAEAVALLAASSIVADEDKDEATASEPETMPDVAPAPDTVAATVPAAAVEDKAGATLRDTVNRQKIQLREKEARIQELQTTLGAAQKERDAVRAEVETVRAALKASEAENERQKRLREREQRKQAAPKAAEPTPTKAAPPTVATVATSGTGEFALALEDTLTRLLNRARWETVAEVCREALGQGGSGSPLPTRARGRIHGFYASALYGLGDGTAGEEHDRQAAAALLESGDATGAADALARLLTHVTAVKPAVPQLLKRLEQLAARNGQADAVQEVFRHMRIASPDAHRRLLSALGGPTGVGGKRNSLLAAPHLADAPILGPDDAVVLAPPGETALTVTPRRVVEAVDSNEEEWVLGLRRALAALAPTKGTDAGQGQQLLEAVANLQAVAAQPFLHRTVRAILVDASNVARYNPDPLAQIVAGRGQAPGRVRHLTQMRDFLLTRGYFPVYLVADATLSFHADDLDAYRALLTRHIVIEVPPGTAADEVLLSEARLRAAPIVSNDTFSDWPDARTIERFAFDFSTGRVALIPAK